MDWNQIETKWAEMARRIRADAQCGENINRAGPEFHAANVETIRTVAAAKKVAMVSAEITKERIAVSTR